MNGNSNPLFYKYFTLNILYIFIKYMYIKNKHVSFIFKYEYNQLF